MAFLLAPDPRYGRDALLSFLSGSNAPAAAATMILSLRLALMLVRDGRGPGVPMKDGLTVGRDEGCDLAIPEASTSRKHAVVEASGDGWVVRDLGSSNGTWRNGRRTTEATPLAAGDVVLFGKAAFKVVGA